MTDGRFICQLQFAGIEANQRFKSVLTSARRLRAATALICINAVPLDCAFAFKAGPCAQGVTGLGPEEGPGVLFPLLRATGAFAFDTKNNRNRLSC